MASPGTESSSPHRPLENFCQVGPACSRVHCLPPLPSAALLRHGGSSQCPFSFIFAVPGCRGKRLPILRVEAASPLTLAKASKLCPCCWALCPGQPPYFPGVTSLEGRSCCSPSLGRYVCLGVTSTESRRLGPRGGGRCRGPLWYRCCSISQREHALVSFFFMPYIYTMSIFFCITQVFKNQ